MRQMRIAEQNIETRLHEGKDKREPDVVKNMLAQFSAGFKAEAATKNEDKFAKKDCWITNTKGQRLSFQIKFRELGKNGEIRTDAWFEIAKCLDPWTLGRDYPGQADFFLHVACNGDGWVYRINDINNFIAPLIPDIRAELDRDPEVRLIMSDADYQIRRVQDPSDGHWKVGIYFDPEKFAKAQKIQVYFRFKNLFRHD